MGAILLGCGLQSKSFDELHLELDLPAPTAITDATKHMTPLPNELSGELASGAAESLQQMQTELKHKQQAWLEDGALKEFEIRGSEEEWQAAIGNPGGGVPLKSVSVKADAKRAKVKDGKKQRRHR